MLKNITRLVRDMGRKGKNLKKKPKGNKNWNSLKKSQKKKNAFQYSQKDLVYRNVYFETFYKVSRSHQQSSWTLSTF